MSNLVNYLRNVSVTLELMPVVDLDVESVSVKKELVEYTAMTVSTLTHQSALHILVSEVDVYLMVLSVEIQAKSRVVLDNAFNRLAALFINANEDLSVECIVSTHKEFVIREHSR